MIRVKFVRLTDTAKIPTKGSKFAAGFDLYVDTDKDVRIEPGETYKFTTGIAMEIPDCYVGLIYSRSGLSSKQGLRLANCVGAIDPEYRGDISIPLYNDSDETQLVTAHERVAQILIQPISDTILYEVKELTVSERGSGGFGSTGRR